MKDSKDTNKSEESKNKKESKKKERDPEIKDSATGKGKKSAKKDEHPQVSEQSPLAGDSSTDFIREMIQHDLESGKHKRVATRFPPEPNGYLHIGHAKSICLNFGIALEYGGTCNLRFDDTNPTKEDVEYVDSIQEDVHWLGFDWQDRLYYASDYFEKLYGYAVDLIKKGKAYVCSLTQDEIREYRGTLTEPGKESPYRNRSVEENLDLFQRMRAGEFEDGTHVLRAKIDMASPNLTMRDPAIYRIRKAHHHRTKDKWCIYPMYDFTHCISDSIEGITHSLCTLEFENNRPLYDWVLDTLGVECHPQQTEFARLNLTYTVMSKRKLLELVNSEIVAGWDDPRMPTLAGMRRRGYTPKAIRNFCDRIGVARRANVVNIELLEYFIREDLNECAPRIMGVLDPLRVVITNYPEGSIEELDAPYYPDKDEMGSRKLPFSRVLYIEQEDFMEDPAPKYYRLSPGREVRLRYAYFIKCVGVVKDASGKIVEIHCTYDPETRGGNAPDGRKVKSTIHWVSAGHAIQAEARLYSHLFTQEDPEAEGDFKKCISPDSLKVVPCYVEPSMAACKPGSHYQFERLAYFCVDKDSSEKKLVFNRTVTLRDTWAKIQKSGQA